MYLSYYHLHPDIPISSLQNLAYFYEDAENGKYTEIIKTNKKVLCNLTNIPPSDSRVFWAKRKGRRTISPCILEKDLLESEKIYTDSIVVVFKKHGQFINIKTAYWGNSKSPCEPQGGLYNYNECVDFWSKHSLIPDESYTIVNPPSWYIH